MTITTILFRLWIKQKIPSRKVTHLPIIRRKSKLSSLYCYFDCCVTTFGNCRNAKMYLSVNDTWECYLNSHTVSNKIFFILITSHRYIWKTYLINIFILHIVSKFETLVHIRKLLMRQKIKSIWNVKDTTTISTEETTK